MKVLILTPILLTRILSRTLLNPAFAFGFQRSGTSEFFLMRFLSLFLWPIIHKGVVKGWALITRFCPCFAFE